MEDTQQKINKFFKNEYGAGEKQVRVKDLIGQFDRGMSAEIETRFSSANYPSGDLVIHLYNPNVPKIFKEVPVVSVSDEYCFFKSLANITNWNADFEGMDKDDKLAEFAMRAAMYPKTVSGQ